MFATSDVTPDNFIERLETTLPGPKLANYLGGLDVGALGELEQLAVLAAYGRLVAHYQGNMHLAVAALASSLGGGHDVAHHEAVESTAVEVGAVLHLTRRSAENLTHLSLELIHRLPEVHKALLAGAIDVARARVLVDGTEHLPEHTARRLAGQLLDDSSEVTASELTTGQLAARLRRLCLEYDPEDAAKRYGRRVEERRVEVFANPEGTANLLGLDLPAERVAEISRYLDQAARKLRRCRMPSVDCDLDHRIRHVDRGCGHDHNLAPLCRFHHRMRHQANWSYRRLGNGDIEWTSGTGRTYLTRNRSP